MKRLLLVAVMTAITIHAFSQDNNLYWTLTADVKMDKQLEYEKKLVTFVKTHHPQLKYRVWEVLTGENTGAYVFVMGPTSYKDLGTPSVSPKGAELRKTDLQALDALCNSTRVSHYRTVTDLSTNNPDRKLNYMVASTTEFKVGAWREVYPHLARMKEAREKGGLTADYVYLRPSNSGIPNAYASVRFVEKMEELDGNYFFVAESYDKIFGNNSWYKDWNDYLSLVVDSRSEIRKLRADLSNL